MDRACECQSDCENITVTGSIKRFDENALEDAMKKESKGSTEITNGECSILDGDGIRTEEMDGYKDVEIMMKTWSEMPELRDWRYKIEFIQDMNGDPTDYCTYEVKWTRPMAGFTYSTITVNVYVFVKMDPENSDSMIDMKYVFEGDRFAHDARLQFNPKWLYNAYEDKKSSIKLLKL